jgi:hypothetical protein
MSVNSVQISAQVAAALASASARTSAPKDDITAVPVGADPDSGAIPDSPSAIVESTSTEHTEPPRNWPWLAEQVETLCNTCSTVNRTYEGSRVDFEPLYDRLKALCKLLRDPPKVELQALKHLPADGLANQHDAGTKLIKDTLDLVKEVAVASEKHKFDKREDPWELCLTIVDGVLATLGAAFIGLWAGGGPFTAAIFGMIAAGHGIALPALRYVRHNEINAVFSGIRDLREELGAPEPSPAEQLPSQPD